MKFFGILMILISMTASAMASSPDSSREELRELLKQRKILFDEYSASLTKKSGIFGNKTKNNLKESQLKLVELVAADNKIMSSLNRTLDFRTFEKQNLSFDASSLENRIRNVNILNDTLNKKVLALTEENKRLRSVINHHNFYFIMLLVLLLLLIAYRLRKYFLK